MRLACAAVLLMVAACLAWFLNREDSPPLPSKVQPVPSEIPRREVLASGDGFQIPTAKFDHEVESYLARVSQRGKKRVNITRTEAYQLIQEVALNEVVALEAKKRGIDLKAEIAKSQAQARENFQTSGLTNVEIEERLQRMAQDPRYADRLLKRLISYQDVPPLSDVSEEELAIFYERNQQYFERPAHRAAEAVAIAFRDQQERAQAEEIALQVRESLAQGKTASEAADAVTTLPTAATSSVNARWLRNPELENVIMSFPEGELSDVLIDDERQRVLVAKAVGPVKPAGIPELEEVRAGALRFMDQKKNSAKREKALNHLLRTYNPTYHVSDLMPPTKGE